MSIVVLKLPDVKRKTEERPRECPYCNGEIFLRWGRVKKPVKDMRCRNVWVYRYRCCRCGRTFRYYPEGTTRAGQTERLRMFAVICWRMGLSNRGGEHHFEWLEHLDKCDDGLAGCPGTGRAAQAAQ